MNRIEFNSELTTFAEDNERLIHRYIQRFNLTQDYYGLLAEGFLHAVQDYKSNKNLSKKYKFSTIAFRRMQNSYSKYLRKESCLKRFHIPVPEAEKVLQNYPDINKSNAENSITMIEATLSPMLNNRQRKVLKLLLTGYKGKEIASLLMNSKNTIYNDIYYLRSLIYPIYLKDYINNKNYIEITGNLRFPLCLWRSNIIESASGKTETGAIVKITKETDTEIEFETVYKEYKLKLNEVKK